jgi:UDP-N-acetyl-alpha-D-quinovosamine dehydrogenase
VSRVLVTGANGFVGSALCERLLRDGHAVRRAVRSAERASTNGDYVVVGELGATTDWRAALRDVDSVVHTAARVHVLDDSPQNERLYTETNAEGTRRLALAAAEARVRRLVVLSSIKVNGEGGEGRSYRATDAPAPVDAYGRSKMAAESHAFEIGRARGMEVVVLRVPLVYGPGVRANFLRLMHWVARRRPLPFGAVRNRRSLLGLGNLCDLLCLLREHPGAPGKVWLGSDGEDLSTAELIRRLARALGTQAKLLPVPEILLRTAGRLAGRGADVARLCGSLQIDSSPVREQLGWRTYRAMDEELALTAAWFRQLAAC